MSTVKTPSVHTERPPSAKLVGTIPSVAGLSVQEFGVGSVRQTLLTFSSFRVTLTDNGVTHAGGAKIYDFPAGLVHVKGITGSLTIASSEATSANHVCSIGSVVGNTSANGTLTSTEADLVASTAAAIASSAGTFNAKSTAALMAANVFDGTSTALGAYLNAAGGADDVGGTRDFTGTILITWENFGDI